MLATTGRGCGGWTADSLYHTWRLGDNGIPVSSLLLCPVIRLDPEKIGLSAQGVTFAEDPWAKGLYHIYDHVGVKFYKYKTDFYREVCWGGFSRKIPKNSPLKMLSKSSIHYLGSPHGALSLDDIDRMRPEVNACPTHNCIKYKQPYANHVKPIGDRDYDTHTDYWLHEQHVKDCVFENGEYYREMPSFRYTVHPSDVMPQWDFGLFMAVPIGNFVITSTLDGSFSPEAEKAAEELQKKGFVVVPHVAETA